MYIRKQGERKGRREERMLIKGERETNDISGGRRKEKEAR